MHLTTEEFRAFIDQSHLAGSRDALLTLRGVIDGLLEKLDAEGTGDEDPS